MRRIVCQPDEVTDANKFLTQFLGRSKLLHVQFDDFLLSVRVAYLEQTDGVNVVFDMEQRLQGEVRPLFFLAFLVVTEITAVLDGEAERAEHVNVTLVVLLGELLLPFLHGCVESLAPDGFVTVNPRKSRDVSLPNGFVLDTEEQFTSLVDGFLFLLRRTVLVEPFLKCP